MESPWRWTLYSVLIVLSRSNVAVLSQDQTTEKPFSRLPMRNKEYVQTIAGPLPQIIQPIPCEYPDISPARIMRSENQRICLLPEGTPTSSPLNKLPPHLTYKPCQLSLTFMPVPQYNTPLQAPNHSINYPFILARMIPPVMVPSPTITSPALTFPSPQIITSLPPTELASLYCPSFPPDNPTRLVPLHQPQVPIEGFQSSLPLTDIGPQANLQNLNYCPLSIADSLRIISLSQSQVLPLENCLPLKISPDNLLPSNNQSPIQNCPLLLQSEPTRDHYVQSMSLLHGDTFTASILQNLNHYPPFYQVKSLPPVLPIVPFISEPSAYSSNQLINTCQAVTGDMGVSQLPITLQINIPESLAPIISIIFPMPSYPNAISVPPFGMSPVVIRKSKSRWKNWLPAFILALFSNNRGDVGCAGSGSCCYLCRRPNTTPENVYIPYPIPISTNNPIICNKDSSGKGRRCDNCDESVDAD